jgi:acyl carrier protein
MIPSEWVCLPNLPLTPNGKVARKALLAMRNIRREASVSEHPAKNQLEETIAGILREVLALERIDRDENFFDLGASSLLLVRVHGRLLQVLDREIQPVEIFNHPTVAALAAHFGDEKLAADSPPVEDRKEKLRSGKERLVRRRQAQHRQRRSTVRAS